MNIIGSVCRRRIVAVRSVAFFALLGCNVCAGPVPEIPPYVLRPARMAHDDGQDAMSARLFRTTTLRRQVNLAGWWDFVSDPADAGESGRYFDKFPQPETQLWVPGTWNAQPRYWQYLGAGWFQRKFDLPENGNTLIRFSGVFYRSKVWLDGRLLGEHEGGYLPFTFLVCGAKKGPHTLVVRADNRLTDETLPHRKTDWFPYGGVDRPVYIELVPDLYIERFQVAHSGGRTRAKLVVNNSGAAVTQNIKILVDGAEAAAATRQVGPGSSTFEFDLKIAQRRIWSPEEPNLYSARALVGADDQFTRFGIREIEVKGNQILLNGGRVKLRGVNRHDDHPEWGSAEPAHLLRQDVEIIKRLGANAVRMHYSPVEMFLDYCDQNGLLFMDEVPSWQYRAEQLAKPVVQEKIKRHFREMLERDSGHVSVLTWSLGNEWPDPDKSYDVIKSLVTYARGLDSSHPITFINGGAHVWRVQELIDVICVNWAKYQWYDPMTYLDAEEGRKNIAALEQIRARYPAKPVIITEFGGAEAQAGWHNWGNVKWSEEYQARNVEDSGRYALESDWVSGGCVWQFSDTRTAPDRILAGRLHGWNGKGIVDAQRSPKLSYYRLQELFQK